MNGENIQLVNGLGISCDWLSWTYKENISPECVIEFMGYDITSFCSLSKGASGYRQQMRHVGLPISILFDGNDDMGIHVDVSGSALPDLVEHYRLSHLVDTPFGESAYIADDSFDFNAFTGLLSEVHTKGQITRLDLAIDDLGEHYFSIDELHDIFYNHHYVSKFRSWDERVKYEKGNIKTGHTIYLGSRTSSIMLRIYDKRLEQLSKNRTLSFGWVRWELELKHEHAHKTVEYLVSGNPLASVAVGILSQYLRIVQNDNPRLDRCTVSNKWELFIDDVPKLALYIPADPKTLDDKLEWFEKQCTPTLATLLIAYGGGTDFMYDLAKKGACRLSGYQKELISQFQHGGAKL